jgi:hypothetical protein
MKRIIPLLAVLFIYCHHTVAQVTIGSDQPPHSSALLELTEGTTTTKGFLGPRVALESIDDQTTIPDPAEGLLVYNTGEAGLQYEGYVFWDGAEWKSFAGEALTKGEIKGIVCNVIQLFPSNYTSGVAYEGTMIVPYTGGNGGVYPEITIGPVNGLTATLAAGNFNVGSGSLSFAVEGTPTVSSPATTEFPVSIGGQSCNAEIGRLVDIVSGESQYCVMSDIDATVFGSGGVGGSDDNGWLSYYVNNLPIIDGKLRLDMYFYGNSAIATSSAASTCNARLVNVSGGKLRFWFSAYTYFSNVNASNVVLAANSYASLDDGMYLNYGQNQTTDSEGLNFTGLVNTQNETMILDVILDNHWYKCYCYPVVDNMNQTTNSEMRRKIFMSVQKLY